MQLSRRSAVELQGFWFSKRWCWYPHHPGALQDICHFYLVCWLAMPQLAKERWANGDFPDTIFCPSSTMCNSCFPLSFILLSWHWSWQQAKHCASADLPDEVCWHSHPFYLSVSVLKFLVDPFVSNFKMSNSISGKFWNVFGIGFRQVHIFQMSLGWPLNPFRTQSKNVFGIGFG